MLSGSWLSSNWGWWGWDSDGVENDADVRDEEHEEENEKDDEEGAVEVVVLGGLLGVEGVDGGLEAEGQIGADGEEEYSCCSPEGIVGDVEGWWLVGCEDHEGEAEATQGEEERE